MTRASSGFKHLRSFSNRRFWRSGFSLVEVVIATGLCTYALVVIACLLPMGMGTVQTANAQIVETEIFNKIWLEVNSTPFNELPAYPRFNGGYPSGTVPPTNWTLGSGTSDGKSYFDKDGGELTWAAGTVPAGTVYIVNCVLVYSTTAGIYSTSTPLPASLTSTRLSSLASQGPPLDGLGSVGNVYSSTGSAGSGLALVLTKIGFHVDPTPITTTDLRVTTRTFVVAKRDTING